MNRLRYYTKIGLIPHAVRKQALPGQPYTVGYYPDYTLDLLLKIQGLRKGGQDVSQVKEHMKVEQVRAHVRSQLPTAQVGEGLNSDNLLHASEYLSNNTQSSRSISNDTVLETQNEITELGNDSEKKSEKKIWKYAIPVILLFLLLGGLVITASNSLWGKQSFFQIASLLNNSHKETVELAQSQGEVLAGFDVNKFLQFNSRVRFQNTFLNLSGDEVSIDQDLLTTSEPTFATLNLTAGTNQIVLGGNGTLAWPTITGNQTISFPDASGTVLLATSSAITINTSGNLSGGGSVSLGGSITLTGNSSGVTATTSAGYIPMMEANGQFGNSMLAQSGGNLYVNGTQGVTLPSVSCVITENGIVTGSATCPTLGVSGTPNSIVKFVTSNTVGDSSISDTGSAVTIANPLTITTGGITLTGSQAIDSSGGTLSIGTSGQTSLTLGRNAAPTIINGATITAGPLVLNTTTNVATFSGQVGVGGDLDVSGFYRANGVPGVSLATASCVITTNGIVTSSAACPGSGSGGSKWQLNSGVLAPNDVTQSLALGGISTGSAQVYFNAVSGDGTFAGALAAATLNTGQGANELYAMNQDVRTSDAPTFGGLTLSNLTTNNGLLYTNGSGVLAQTTAGTSGQCLVGNTGSAPSWSDCGTASGDDWQRNAGAISPLNVTDSLIIGGTATSSGKFQIYGVSSLNPVASISASSSKAAFIVDNTVGDLFTASSSGLSRFVIKQNGNIGIGTSNPGGAFQVVGGGTSFTLNSSGVLTSQFNVANDIVPTTDASRSLGNSSNGWFSLYTNQIHSTNSEDLSLNSSGTQIYVLDTLNFGSVSTDIITGTNEDLVITPGGTGNVGINTSTPQAKFQVFNSSNSQTASISAANGKSALLVDNTVGDLITASSSGISRFTVKQNGDVIINTLAASNAVTYVDSTGKLNGVTPNGSSIMCLTQATSGAPQWSDCNSGGGISGSGTLNYISKFTPDGSTLGNTGLYETSGALGYGTIAPLAKLDIQGGATTSAIASFSGATGKASLVVDNSVGDLFTASSSGMTRFVINQNGNVGIGTSNAANALDVKGNVTVRGNSTGTPGGSQGLLLGYSSTGNVGSITSIYSGNYFTTLSLVAAEITFNTGASGTEQMRLTQQATLGLGTTVPLGRLDVRGNSTIANSGTNSVATFSGATSKAVLVVDNSGVGDLITASSSGMSRFTVKQNGDVIINSLAAANAVTYVDSTGKLNGITPNGTGTALCLTQTSSGTPTWASCNSGGGISGSGTLNYISKFTPDGSTLGNSSIFDNGSVQIGGATPVALFNIGANSDVRINGTGDITARTFNGNTIATGSGNLTISGTANVDQDLRTVSSPTFAGLTLSSLTTNNGLLYTNGSGVIAQSAAGATGECLIGNTGSAPTWSSCSSAASDDWQRNSGVLSPTNITDSLIIGGTSTASGKFQVYGLSSLNPVASISGSSAVAALVVDNSAGDVFTASTSGLTRFVVNKNGNIGIGTSNPTRPFHVVDGSSVIYASNNIGTTLAYGTSSLDARNGFVTLGNNAGSITYNGTEFYPQVSNNVNIGRASLTYKNLYLNNLQVLNSGTTANASISGSTAFAGLVVDNSGVGDLITASSSGASRFTVKQNGDVVINSLAAANAVTYVDSTGKLNGITPNAGAIQCLTQTSSGTPVWAACSSGGGLSGSGTLNYISKFTPDGSTLGNTGLYETSNALGYGTIAPLAKLDIQGGATTSAIASFSGSTGTAALVVDNSVGDLFTASSSGLSRFVIKQNGTVGIGLSAPGNLQIGVDGAGAANNFTAYGTTSGGRIVMNGSGLSNPRGTNNLWLRASDLVISNGTITTVNSDLTLAPMSTYNTVITSGNVGIGSATPGTTLDITGTLRASGVTTLSNYTTNNGLLYTNGSGVVAQTAAGSTGECLIGNTGSAPSWSSCSSAASDDWQRNAGVLSPTNITDSLIIGGTATSSGKFQIYGVSSLNPVASISASSSQAALVIDNTVGDLFTASSSGLTRFVINQNGNVGIGTSNPSYKLDVVGTNMQFWNGGTGNGFNFTTAASGGDVTLTATGPTSAGDFIIKPVSTSGSDLILTSPNGITKVRGGDPLLNIEESNGTLRYAFSKNTATFDWADYPGVLTFDTNGISYAGAALNLGTSDSNLVALKTGGSERMRVDTNGNIGVGTTAPIGLLNVSNKATGKALTILNETGDQNILVGSASGTTEFVFDRTGGLTLTGLAGSANSLVYVDANGKLTNTAAGTSGQCLVGNTGAPASWSSCSGAAGGLFWQRNSGVLAPQNISESLAIGGTSTSSALAYFDGVNGNALLRGGLSVASSSGAAALTVNQSSTGDIFTASAAGVSKFVITAAGNVGIGTTVPGASLSINNSSGTSADIVQQGTSFYGLLRGNLIRGGTSSSIYGQIDLYNGSTGDLNIIPRGSNNFTVVTNSIERFRIDGNGNVGVGTTVPLATLNVKTVGNTQTASISGTSGTAALLVDNTVGDLFTASSSGASRFTVKQNGDVIINSLAAANAVTYVDSTGKLNGITPNGTGTALCLTQTSSGTPTWASCNSGGGISGSGTLNYISKFTPDGSTLGNSGLFDTGSALSYGTTNALATLDIRSQSGITGIASISGSTAHAALVVDNSGVGDIFTASSSGLTRFVIQQNGNVAIGGAVRLGQNGGANDVLNTAAAIGAPSGQLYWGSRYLCDSTNNCVGGGGGGAIGGGGVANYISKFTPDGNNIGNSQLYDTGSAIAIGTTSPLATIDVRSQSGITGIASISGSTAHAALVVDNSGVGDIFTASSAGLARFVIKNSGNIGIGTTTTTAKLTLLTSGVGDGFTAINSSTLGANSGAGIVGRTSSDPTGADQRLGFYVFGSNGSNAANSAGMLGYAGGAWSGSSKPAYLTFETTAVGSTSRAEQMRIDANGNVGISSSVPGAKLDVLTSAGSGQTALFSNYGTGVPLTLTNGSGSTSNVFSATRFGSQVFRVGGTGDYAMYASHTSATVPVGFIYNSDVSGTGLNILGANGATGKLLYVQSWGSTDLLTVKGNGDVIMNGGNIGIGSASPIGKLNVSGAATGKALTILNETGDQNILVGSASGVTEFVFDRSGGLTLTGLSGSANSLVYVDANGKLTNTAAGTSGQCLVGNTGSPASWSDCGTASGDDWQRNAGALSPKNISDSLIIGGTATSSGKFQVYGVSSLNPVASISASSSQAALVIDNTVGDLFTASSSGLTRFVIQQNGNVGIGYSNPSGAKLAINGGVGIGTTTASYALDVEGNIRSRSTGYIGTNAEDLGLYLGPDTSRFIFARSGGTLSIGAGSNDRITLLSGGNVGINSTTPGANFDVTGTARISGVTTLSNYTTNNGLLYTNGSGVIAQTAAGATGECLIGNTGSAPSWSSCSAAAGGLFWQRNSGVLAPQNISESLAIGGTSTSSALAYFDGVNGNALLRGGAYIASSSGKAALTVNQSSTGDLFTASAAGASRFVINNVGNVGVGTSNPTNKLYVAAGAIAAGSNGVLFSGDISGGNMYSAQLGVFNSGSANAPTRLQFGDLTAGEGTAVIESARTGSLTGYLAFQTRNTNYVEAMRINSDGNVGINTTLPVNKLDVSGSAAFGSYAGANSAPSNGLIVSGNVGVGTTTPGGILEVSGHLTGWNPFVLFEDTGDPGAGATTLEIKNSQSDLKIRAYGSTAPSYLANAVGLWSDANDMINGVGSGKKIYLASNDNYANPEVTIAAGNVGIGSVTPGFKFDVNGNTNSTAYYVGGVAGAASVSNSCVNVTNGIVTSAGTCALAGNQWQLNSGVIAPYDVTQSVAIGGTATSSALVYFNGVNGNALLRGGLSVASSSGAAALTVNQSSTGDIFTASAAGASKFVITAAGNVGIGSSAPGNKFVVNGGALVDGGSVGVIKGDNSTGSFTAHLNLLNNGTAGNVVRLGFGDETAGEGVAAIESARTGSQQGYLSFRTRNATMNEVGRFDHTGNLGIGYSSSLNGKLVVNGNVGIGTSTANAALEVVGTTGMLLKANSSSAGFTIKDRASVPGDQLIFEGNTGNYTVFNVGTNGATSGSPKQSGFALWTVDPDSTDDATQFQVQSNPTYGGVVFTQKFGSGAQGDYPISLQSVWDQVSTPSQLVLGTGGNVGVGSSSPGNKLDVTGTLRASGVTTLSNYTTNNGLLYTNGSGVIAQTAAGSTGQCLVGATGSAPSWAACAAGSRWQLNSGVLAPNDVTQSLAIGGTATGSALAYFDGVNGNALLRGGLSVASSSGKAALTVNQSSTGDLFTASAAGASRFVINNAGNVGIGTSNPTQKLVVGGATSELELYSDSDLGTIDSRALGGSSSRWLVINPSGGNVGIGTTGVSNSKFLVYGDSGASATNSLAIFGDNLGMSTDVNRAKVTIGNTDGISELLLGQDSTHGLLFNWNYNATAGNAYGVLETYGGNNPLALQTAGGNVGIGSITPGYKLDVNGNTNSTGYYVGGVAGASVTGQCVTTTNGIVTASATCPATGGSKWQLNSGVLAPNDVTQSLAIGGTATSSALVYFDGVNGNALLRGGLSVASSSGKAALTVNQSSTGDIFTASAAGASKFVITSAGNVGVNTTNPAALLEIHSSNNYSNSGLVLTNNVGVVSGGLSLGGSGEVIFSSSNLNYLSIQAGGFGIANSINDSYSGLLQVPNGLQVNPASASSIGLSVFGESGQTANLSNWYDSSSNLLFSVNNRGYIANEGNITGLNNIPGSLSVNDILSVAATSSAYPAFRLNATTGQAAMVINQDDPGGDLFTASAAGSPKVVISNVGFLGVGTTTPGGIGHFRQDANGGVRVYVDNASNGSSASVGIALRATLLTGDGTFNIAKYGSGYSDNPNWTNAGVISAWNDVAGIRISSFNGLAFETGNNAVRGSWTNTGNLGINTTAPLSLFDVRGVNGTNAYSGISSVATISGQTSFATLVVDNSGVGDLFTASSSGLTRFVINQNGNIGIGTTYPTAKLAFGAATTAAGGIDFGGDVSLYRSAADILKTGDTFSIRSTIGITATGPALIVGGDGLSDGVGNVGINKGSIEYYSSGYGLNLGRPNIGPIESIISRSTDGSTGYIDIGNNTGWTATTLQASGGNVGIGTTVPMATLDVRRSNGTIATASISGATSFAGLVVDNSGVGDLFTASSSGLTRFVINNVGDVLPGTDDAQDLGSNALRWRDLYLGSDTLHIGTSTSDEYTLSYNTASNYLGFNVNGSGNSEVVFDANGNVGIGSITPGSKLDVAGSISMSGSQTLTSTGTLGIGTANQTALTLGRPGAPTVIDGSTITINGALINGGGSATISGTLGLGGDASFSAKLTLDSTTPQINATNNRPLQLGFMNTGSVQFMNASNYVDANNNLYINGVLISGSAVQGHWQRNSGAVAPTNITDSLLVGGTSTASAKFQVYGLSALNPVASISGSSSKAALIVDNTVGDLFAASSSGLSRFVINQNGNVGIGTTNPAALFAAGQSNQFRVNSAGTAYITNAAGSISLASYIDDEWGTFITTIGGSGQNWKISPNPGNRTAIAYRNFQIADSYNPFQFTFRTTVEDGSGANNLTLSSYFEPWQTNRGNMAALYVPYTVDAAASQNGIVRGIYVDSTETSLNGFTNNLIDLRVGGVPKFVVGASGTSTTATVSGTTSSAALVVDNSGVGDVFSASAAGVSRFVVTSGGNIGIGTNIPGYKLQVASGQIAVADGSAGTPSYSFFNDPDNGMFRPGPNTIGLSAGGSQVFYGTLGGSVVSGYMVGDASPLTLGNNNDWGVGEQMQFDYADDSTVVSRIGSNQHASGDYSLDFYTTTDGGSSLPARLRIGHDGNIGINTTAPLSLLDVRGISGTNAYSGISSVATVSGKTSFAAMVVDNSGVGDLFTASSSGLSRFVISQNGNIGIGTTVPDAKVTILGGNDIKFTGVSAQNQASFIGSNATDDFSILAGIGNGKTLTIGANGSLTSLNRIILSSTALQILPGNTNVGINTSAPAAVVDIRGSQGSNTMSGIIPVASISGQTSFAALVVNNNFSTGDIFTASASGLNRFVIKNNGWVGIGTANPSATLDLVGNASISGQLVFPGSTNINGSWIRGDGGNSHLEIGTGTIQDANARLYITSAGNIGVNTTNPGQTFDINGSLRVRTSVAGTDTRTLCVPDTTGVVEFVNGACGTSSLRYKENVKDIGYGLDQIKQLKPVFFNYIRDSEVPNDLDLKDDRTKRRIGFIAEEMQQVVPEVVIWQNGQIESIDYSYLTALLTKGVQDLAGEVDALKVDVSNIAPDISNQLSEIPQIKADLAQTQSEMASVSAQLADVSTRQASDSAKLAELLEKGMATNSGNINGATVSGDLKVLGITELAKTVIGGKLSVGLVMIDDIKAEISSLTGLVKIDGILSILKLRVDTGDVAAASAGKATILSGESEIEITTTALTPDSMIFATPEDVPVAVSTTKTGGNKFKIKLASPAVSDIKISWWIVN